MIDSANSSPSVNNSGDKAKKFAWGVAEIAKVIERNNRQANHLLATGQIKSAKKLHGRWVAPIAELLREFGESA